ncbi:hypothetical protein [Aquimarina sp. 2201CG14-23]|uniref:hypothetical protein n=1 Tax=Aquimarina mycalae TaxID=3040073 RepID=UPI002477E77B|nr:hypothetical protein [Aquimarina sp. 2201CG14-23]MDH7445843.1 hypothetical protein [Aquimarina sp. 2201CG14-23]
MEFRPPKVLEKKPSVAGFDIKIAVVIVVGGILFLFAAIANFLVALIIPLIVFPYVQIELKFPGEGEFLTFIQYQSGVKCIRINQKIKGLVMNVKRKSDSD